MDRIKLIRKWLRENSNFKYRVFLSVFFCLMAVFITSKLWLPSDAKIENTDIGSERDTSLGTALTLNNWKYNPQGHFMEATFSYKDSDISDDIKFSAIAHPDTNKTAALDISIPYGNDGLLIIQIKNVPQKWNTISLWVDETDESLAQDDTSDTGVNSTDGDSNTVGQGANFYCDIRKVSVDTSLKGSTDLYYSLKSIDNQMAEYKKVITTLNKKISAANINIKQLEFDISSLKDDQKYQTADDIQESNSAISNKELQESDLKSSIENYNADIKNYNEKLKKLKQKWSDTKSGKIKGLQKTPPNSMAKSAASSSVSSNAENESNVIVD